MKKKKLIFDILKVLAFFLAFVVVLEALSLIFFVPEKAGIRIDRTADAYAFTQEDDYTIDIVGVGNSDLY